MFLLKIPAGGRGTRQGRVEGCVTQSVRAQGQAFLLPLPAPFSHKQKRGFKKRKKRAAGRGTRRPHRLCIKHFTSRSPSSASMPSLLRQDAIRHARPEAEKPVSV